MAGRRTPLTALALLAACALAPAVAHAHTRAARHRPLGVIAAHHPFENFAGDVLSRPAAQAKNMTSDGGPVMRSNVIRAIFWAPPGFSFDPGYEQLITKYLQDVAAARGRGDDVYAVATQYGDSHGPVSNETTFAGAFNDNAPLPAAQCSDLSTPKACVTDGQLQSEITRFAQGHHLPIGFPNGYLMFTPKGVGGCFSDSDGKQCAYTDYCAYHSSSGSDTRPLLYADLPYGNVDGCASGEYPNSSNADPMIDSLSHEHIEMITDPLGNAWSDADGNEIADKCSDWYGPALGQKPGGAYDQLINGDPFYVQGEWSNQSSSCAAGYIPAPSVPTPAFTVTGAGAGGSARFDASRSADQGAAIVSYQWDFGDGTSASGKTVKHAFAHTGAHTVTLTVTDTGRQSASVPQTVMVGAGPSMSVPRQTLASVLGSGLKVTFTLLSPARVSINVRSGGTLLASHVFGRVATGTWAATFHLSGQVRAELRRGATVTVQVKAGAGTASRSIRLS